MSRSPWQRAVGSRVDGLDPGLRTYFGPIPLGSVGHGEGVFDAVGTPRRWLWPLLAVVGLDGIAFPVWERSVPFTITNRPTAHGTVVATRVFHFADGARTMSDEVGITRAGLTDRLGDRGTVIARLDAGVDDGRLVLRSSGVVLALGPLRVPLGVLSPRVALVESTRGDEQHVSLRITVPLIGTIYEYSGSFHYAVESEG